MNQFWWQDISFKRTYQYFIVKKYQKENINIIITVCWREDNGARRKSEHFSQLTWTAPGRQFAKAKIRNTPKAKKNTQEPKITYVKVSVDVAERRVLFAIKNLTRKKSEK